MVSRDIIQAQLDNCLLDAKFDRWADSCRQGKVRDMYLLPGRRVFITTDRQSAFDHVLGTIPFKGQVLNRIAQYWFEQTRDRVPNHVFDVPHPNVTIGEELEMFPVEIVVRGFLTGSTETSAWTHYSRGVRDFCGNRLPEGMVKNQPFETPIITPTTKSKDHDEGISAAQIMDRGLVDEATWRQIESIAMDIFTRGQHLAATRGLILVDTKYEMGINSDGKVALADEIHTPDSSRFWIKETYRSRHEAGQEPESLDKEFLRLWLKERNISDTNIVPLDDYIRVQVAERYIQLFERITGETFEPDLGDGTLRERIEAAIEPFMN
ncbi:phosphoribosylaminoimidazolesuccinocarboxamide synthase [bacterium CG10_46_32]|nr:MAG: phosphoribosylaminoimidazolesuccinocarboxamide synthase [bacterium CG10_46_32]PIR56383.1 MAG: phosphoribosylaminoimidazolesuccinocarboxamide synthase [Parcubacteria group bacterium CG10_big_fil_rev_8_21_14_0_10_46_32]